MPWSIFGTKKVQVKDLKVNNWYMVDGTSKKLTELIVNGTGNDKNGVLVAEYKLQFDGQSFNNKYKLENDYLEEAQAPGSKGGKKSSTKKTKTRRNKKSRKTRQSKHRKP